MQRYMLTRRRFFQVGLMTIGGCMFLERTYAGENAMLGITKMIQVEIEKRNCGVELYVNGIPMRKSLLSQPFNSISAHQYLIDGVNEIELVIFPGPTPSQVRIGHYEKDSAGIFAETKLVKYLVDVYPRDTSGELLVKTMWQGESNNKEIFPKIVKAKADLGHMFGRWPWQDAEKLELNKQTTNEIVEYVKAFHKAFTAGDGKQILSLAKMRLDAAYRAYPGADREHESSLFINDVEERKNNPAWKVTPLNPTQFDFRLCAGDRMVEIVNKDWKPTIRGIFEDTGEEYSYRMFLSRINGKFHMVL